VPGLGPLYALGGDKVVPAQNSLCTFPVSLVIYP